MFMTSSKSVTSHRLGAAGEGFKLAMRSLDIFRASVAAAALGLARRALDEALDRVTTRAMFGRTLAEFQLTQAALAELMRTRGIDLANQSKAAKLATTDNTRNNSLINGSLTNR